MYTLQHTYSSWLALYQSLTKDRLLYDYTPGKRPKPLFIKAIRVEGAYACDPVISVKDAKIIKELDGLNQILDKARVIFVVGEVDVIQIDKLKNTLLIIYKGVK